MKKIVLLVAFLCVGLGYAQTYRISTVGESKQFVIEDVTNGVRERPYLNREVLADTTSEGRINIYRQLGVDYLKPIGFPSPKGHPYTAFLDGNNSDATFESAAAVDTWFKNYTGFNTAGGAASSTVYGNKSNVTMVMSVGDNSKPSAPYNHLTESHMLTDSKEDAYMHGGWHYDTGSNPVLRQFPVINITSGGAITSTTDGNSWTASFKVSGAFSFRVDGQDPDLLKYKIIVNGVDYLLTNTTGVGNGRRWMTVDPGRGVHHVKVIGVRGAYWSGYVTELGAIAEPWEVTRTTFYFGDSFTNSTGADRNYNGFAFKTKLSENHNVCASGLGSSGYTQDGPGEKLSDRIIDDYNSLIAANGVPDEVVIAMGLNDKNQAGIEAAADLAFDNLRTVYDGKVYVVGLFDVDAPSPPTTAYTTVKTATKNAVSGRSGFYFIDTEGIGFTKSDGVHPDNAGHQKIADYLKQYLINPAKSNTENVIEDLRGQVKKLTTRLNEL